MVTIMSANRRIETYKEFVKVHDLLLAASGLPESLHKLLFQKLAVETFDGGHYFQIEPCEDGRQRRLLLTSNSMPRESNIFFIDHAWTFRLSDAYKQLQEVPGLAERMAALMCVDINVSSKVEENGHEEDAKPDVAEMLESEVREAKGKGDGTLKWLELEELDIDDDMLLSLRLSSRFPDLLAFSLLGNKLHRAEVVVQEVTKFKHLKALWLNNNRLLINCQNCIFLARQNPFTTVRLAHV